MDQAQHGPVGAQPADAGAEGEDEDDPRPALPGAVARLGQSGGVNVELPLAAEPGPIVSVSPSSPPGPSRSWAITKP